MAELDEISRVQSHFLINAMSIWTKDLCMHLPYSADWPDYCERFRVKGVEGIGGIVALLLYQYFHICFFGGVGGIPHPFQ